LANNLPGHEVVFESPDATDIERIMQSVVEQPQFGNAAGCCLWPQSGATMKRVGIPFCVSQAIELGTIISTYKGTSHSITDIVSIINRIRPMKYVGSGIVKLTNVVDNECLVRVNNSTTNVTLTLTGLNQNAITYSSEETGPLFVDPDIVSYLTDDGTVLTISDLVNDMNVHVVALPCLEVVRKNTKLMQAFAQANSLLGFYGKTFTNFPPYIPTVKRLANCVQAEGNKKIETKHK